MVNSKTKVAIATAHIEIPNPPSTSLPPLGRLSTTSTEKIQQALRNLQILYFPPPSSKPTTTSTLVPPKLTVPERHISHPIHDTSVPDSGYASAEEDDGDEKEEQFPCSDEDEDQVELEVEELELLRADEFERAYSIKWVTGFISRADTSGWTCSTESAEEVEERGVLLEQAVSLLSAFTGTKDEDEVALTRTFTFPKSILSGPSGDRLDRDTITGAGACASPQQQQIYIKLNDAPLAKDDHTSVGLQSWGSSIILADRFCLDPGFFSLAPPPPPSRSKSSSTSSSSHKPLRILELGAGTGMLSIVASKLVHPVAPDTEIVATDYHPDVLANLALNVETNFPNSNVVSSGEGRAPIRVDVRSLDWEKPNYDDAPFDRPFDLILAADVIYHPLHARWIKACVERLLARPDAPTTSSADSGVTDGHGGGRGGAFWLIIPVRTTGRHEGMAATVDDFFPDATTLLTKRASESECERGGPELAVLYREEHGRQGSIGRADEGAYKLFKIGWV